MHHENYILFFKSDFSTATTGRYGLNSNKEGVYKSSRYWMKYQPHDQPRDDFESLVFSIWHVAGIKREQRMLFNIERPEGETLAECLKTGPEFAKQKIKVSNRETMANH